MLTNKSKKRKITIKKKKILFSEISKKQYLVKLSTTPLYIDDD